MKNEDLNGKLVEILSSIQTATGKASDFALEQLPDIVQSYVLYEQVRSLFMVGVWLCLLAGIVLAARWVKNNPVYCTNWGNIGKQVRSSDNATLLWITYTLAALAAFFTLNALENAALVWIAPKVWLLKGLAGMIVK